MAGTGGGVWAWQVVFEVPKRLTKPEIKDYLEKVYRIGVKGVNTYVAQGKLKRMAQGNMKRRPDVKRAIVSLMHPWTAPLPPPPTPKKDDKQAPGADGGTGGAGGGQG